MDATIFELEEGENAPNGFMMAQYSGFHAQTFKARKGGGKKGGEEAEDISSVWVLQCHTQDAGDSPI